MAGLYIYMYTLNFNWFAPFLLFDSRFFFTGSSEMAEMMTKEEQDRMDDVQSVGANPTLSM